MREVSTIAELRRIRAEVARRNERFALVPTMGALHEGHLRLVDEGRARAEIVALSIFVNPLQFAPGEDFDRYPRDLASDRRLAADRGVDILFTPSVVELYPDERAVEVVPRAMADRYEGAARPGHFTGVLTVVAKLFNIVQPNVAVFGQKDIQQATLIRAMVRDLDIPVEIVVSPTVRDPDGLAMSSRNRYLSLVDRKRALSLPRALDAIRDAHAGGETDAEALASHGRAILDDAGVRLDYLSLMDPDTLAPVAIATSGTIVAVAARVGATRLIDNTILDRE